MADQQQSGFDQIRRHIPEFPGYADPFSRIHADTILRAYVDGKISHVLERLLLFIQSSATEKRLDLLSDFEDIRESLSALSGRLASDVAHESEPWTSGTIEEEPLARIHENDGELVDAVQSVLDRIIGMKGPVPDRPEVLLLKNAVDRLLGRFQDRCTELEELGLVGETTSR